MGCLPSTGDLDFATTVAWRMLMKKRTYGFLDIFGREQNPGCVFVFFFHTDWTKKIWISLANSMDLKEHIWNLASEMLFLDVLESITLW